MIRSRFTPTQEREHYLEIPLLHQKVNGVAGKIYNVPATSNNDSEELVRAAATKWVKNFESYLERKVGYMTYQYTGHSPRVGTVTVNGTESTIVSEIWSDSVLITVRNQELIDSLAQLLGAEIVGDNRFLRMSKSQITQLK